MTKCCIIYKFLRILLCIYFNLIVMIATFINLGAIICESNCGPGKKSYILGRRSWSCWQGNCSPWKHFQSSFSFNVNKFQYNLKTTNRKSLKYANQVWHFIDFPSRFDALWFKLWILSCQSYNVTHLLMGWLTSQGFG